MKQIFTILFALASAVSFAQSFEGTLKYTTDFQFSEKMEKMGVTREMIREKMQEEGTWSDTIRIIYKNGNYRTELNSNPRSWSIYKPESNKIYTFQEGEASGICTVTDAGADYESTLSGKLPRIEKQDTTVVINGRNCEVVTVKWKSGTYSYYYEKGYLQVDPKLFKAHIYDGWSEFLQLSGALPVRIVKEVNGMSTATMDLVSATPETIDIKLFDIPKLKPDPELNMMKIGNREIMRIK